MSCIHSNCGLKRKPLSSCMQLRIRKHRAPHHGVRRSCKIPPKHWAKGAPIRTYSFSLKLTWKKSSWFMSPSDGSSALHSPFRDSHWGFSLPSPFSLPIPQHILVKLAFCSGFPLLQTAMPVSCSTVQSPTAASAVAHGHPGRQFGASSRAS